MVRVKETWSPDHAAFYPHMPVVYKADSVIGDWEIEDGKTYSPEQKAWYPFKWRSPMYMPESLSRIHLTILDVRCERLLQMTHRDWIADFHPSGVEKEQALASFTGKDYQTEHIQKRWNAINGKKVSADRNPWVWVYTFKRSK